MLEKSYLLIVSFCKNDWCSLTKPQSSRYLNILSSSKDPTIKFGCVKHQGAVLNHFNVFFTLLKNVLYVTYTHVFYNCNANLMSTTFYVLSIQSCFLISYNLTHLYLILDICPLMDRSPAGKARTWGHQDQNVYCVKLVTFESLSSSSPALSECRQSDMVSVVRTSRPSVQNTWSSPQSLK